MLVLAINWPIGWIVLASGLLVCCLAIVYERQRRRRSLAERSTLEFEDIYAQYYSAPGLPKEELLTIWAKIAEILHVDPGKLRPNDSLQFLAGHLRSGQTDIDDLEAYVQERIFNPSGESPTLTTIDDIIRLLVKGDKK